MQRKKGKLKYPQVSMYTLKQLLIHCTFGDFFTDKFVATTVLPLNFLLLSTDTKLI